MGADAFYFFSDDDGELELVIDLLAVIGPGDDGIGADDDGGWFEEGPRDGGLAGGIGEAELETAFDAGFFYVFGVIAGEGDDFGGSWDGSKQFHIS